MCVRLEVSLADTLGIVGLFFVRTISSRVSEVDDWEEGEGDSFFLIRVSTFSFSGELGADRARIHIPGNIFVV